MEIIDEKIVSPKEIKEKLLQYGNMEDPIILKTLENLEDIMDLPEEKIEKLKEIGLTEEEIYKIIEINPKRKETLGVIIKDKEKLEKACEILFGEQ